MLKSLRRSFGMSPSSSSIQADYAGSSDVPAGVLSPSNKPNTFIPLRRSNSFTNFFSSSRPSSPVKESFEQSSANATTSPAQASSTAETAQAQADPDAVLAYLVLLDKKGRQKERFPIQTTKTTMGRSLDNDVRFLVNDVSRHHCTIEIEIKQLDDTDANRAFLQVLGANGVLLNGTQAFPAPRGQGRYELHTGDSIIVAKRSFVFELPLKASSDAQAAESDMFASPVKRSTQSSATVPQTPATTHNRRRVRMSLVNAAQINTPARPSQSSASPSKTGNAAREARRANGLERFMQSAIASPSKANKSKSRQSFASSASVTNLFGTPAKSRNSLVEPKTAPPKQVSFSLYANSFTGRLSPVKQMRMMPPLDTMDEEQDGSFGSEKQRAQDEEHVEDAEEHQEDKSEEDIVIVEELEQEQEPAEALASTNDLEAANDRVADTADGDNSEHVPPSASCSGSTPDASPSKNGSPKRAKRRSSFFGRAGPFRGMSLGFYAEERTDDKEAQDPKSDLPQPSRTAEEAEEEFSDASDVEPMPMEQEPASQPLPSPTARRVVSRSITLGISKTPSPVKHQHFVGLTPLPRRPRLSLASRRKVSLRTQTLLRSSEAYADRLFLPPPPPTPVSNCPSGLSKSLSMPSNISAVASMQPLPALQPSASYGSELSMYSDDVQSEEPEAHDFESQMDSALKGHEVEPQAWKDSEEDEDEVDQSLSLFSPSPQKTSAYGFSPVKASTLPQFATPQPASKTHSRRISMPPAGAADVRPSIRSALVRLQISGAGERIVHEVARKEAGATTIDVSQAIRSSPSKARKVVRVSDVGLPATELSMGFDLVEDATAEPESDKIAQALNDLFVAEEQELTDDEADKEEAEEQEEIVQISSKAQQSPTRPSSTTVAPLQAPQTPAALNSVRHLFSAASAAPATPDMNGLGALLNASPEKAPQYGVLGDRMRANPDIVELLSPTRSSPKKKAMLGSSPVKGRRGVRRSQAAEIAAAAPATPRAVASSSAAVTPVRATPVAAAASMQPAFEAELHVTMFDVAAMNAENEAMAQALAESEEQSEQVESIAANPVVEEARFEAEAAEEQENAVPQPREEIEHASEPVPEPVALPEISEAVEEEEEAVDVPKEVAPAATEQQEVEIASPEQPAPSEASPSKTRASRRAASASPTKRTARSASPTKRVLRSSPIKRSAAPPASISQVFAPETETTQEKAVEETTVAPAEEVEQEQEPAELETSSPSKPARRTGGRKAKQAATEAISATLAPAEVVQLSSPEKPTRRGRAAAAAKNESEEKQHEDVAEEVQESGHEAKAKEEVEEAPKRATRTRATRAAAAANVKPVRATRTRAAKADVPALPSSSAGYGDDEASEEEDAPAKTKRATAPRTRTTRTKATSRSTKSAKVEASEDEVAEPSAHQDDDDAESEEQGEPAKTTRARATASRTTRAKAASTTASKSRGKAKAAPAEEQDEGASSSTTTTTTTRSGRTTRRTAAK